jgi:molybdenum cofactor cytidylyltransferase
MGVAKQLLPFGTRTVLQTVVDFLLAANLDGITVVLGHQSLEVERTLKGLPVAVQINANYHKGMFTSVLCGLHALPETADGVLLVLGDQPQIRSEVVREVVAAYRRENKGIVIPTCQGRRGHPALVDVRKYRAEIESLDGDKGLKPVMRGHPEDTLELRLEDPAILRDLDTPEDYRSELERQGLRPERAAGPRRRGGSGR